MTTDGPLVSTLQVETAPDSVRFVLQVTNASAAPVEVRFNTGQTFDFLVRDDRGAEIWRWSADMGFTQALRSETLAPGETRTLSAAWRPGAGLAGRELTAVGRLTSGSHPLERRLAFRLP